MGALGRRKKKKRYVPIPVQCRECRVRKKFGKFGCRRWWISAVSKQAKQQLSAIGIQKIVRSNHRGLSRSNSAETGWQESSNHEFRDRITHLCIGQLTYRAISVSSGRTQLGYLKKWRRYFLASMMHWIASRACKTPSATSSTPCMTPTARCIS